MAEYARSGLCHGPGCRRPIDPRGASADFCGDECQASWLAEANGSQVGEFQRDGLLPSAEEFRRLWLNDVRSSVPQRGHCVHVEANRQVDGWPWWRRWFR